MVSDTSLPVQERNMALSGLKAPAPLNLSENLQMNWREWIHAYEMYAGAAGVTAKGEKTQCCVFLHVAGREAQKVHRAMHFESTDRDKIAPLIAAFRVYCEGRTNTTVIRYRFNSYNQTDETMDVYIRELKNRIACCNYMQGEDDMLCDRIVCGVRDDALRDRLLQTPNLTLEMCIERCRMSEHTSDQIKEKTRELNALYRQNAQRTTPPFQARATPPFQARAAASPPARATPPGPGTQPRRSQQAGNSAYRQQCGNCGYSHGQGNCPARGKQCLACGKVGHFGKVCRGRTSETAVTTPVNEIYMDNEEQPETETRGYDMEDDYELFVGEIAGKREQLWYTDIQVGGHKIRFKLDSGSEANIIPRRIYEQVNATQLTSTRCRLVTYSGQRLIPEGETTVTINGHKLCFQVVAEGSPILGIDACVTLNLITRVDTICTIEATEAEKLVKHYNDIFHGLGHIKSNAIIHVDPNVTPTIDPPRRIPHAVIDEVRAELDKMLKMGVIKKQDEPTPWVSSITIVRKPGKTRICIDPTKLNRAILRGPYPIRTIEEVVAKTHGACYFSVLDANSGYWQVQLDENSSRLCTFNTP